MNINDQIGVNLKLLCRVLRDMQGGYLEITEKGVRLEKALNGHDLYIDLVRFDNLIDEHGNPAHEYLLINYEDGEEKPFIGVPENTLGPGVKEILDEFFECIWKEQKRKGLKDYWEDDVRKEMYEAMNEDKPKKKGKKK